MRELRLGGDRLKDLYDYLSKEYGKFETDVVNVDDHKVHVFVSERNLRLVVNVGCMILYQELNPKACEIKIYCAGGGHGKLNIDYGAVKAAEKKIYKSILDHASKLGLR